MKKLIVPLILLLIFFCGCEEAVQQIDVEAILRSVVENIDWAQLKDYAEQGADVLLEKFPALRTLADQEKMQVILKDKGLDLMNEYLKSTEPSIQENAQKVGAIIKILYPELIDEVDAVLTD